MDSGPRNLPLETRGKYHLTIVLIILMLANALNYFDRTILSITGPAIKTELNLSDTQLGLLSGLAFSLIYSCCALPIARMAEHYSRRLIITISIVAWSAMTMLCGTATSFPSLFAFRTGVGIGESGFNPATNSLISDYFPPSRRASAISIFVMGIPFGIFIGSVTTGWIVDLFSWRMAFFLLGIPGFLLALAVLLVVREPRRGQFDDPSLADGPHPKLLDVAKRLLSKPSFIQLVLGMGLVSIVMSGLGAFLSLYLVREFGLSLTQVGLVYGMVWGVSATVGASVSGYVCDRASHNDKRWHVWLPGILLLISSPLLVLAVHMPSWHLTALVLALPVGMTSFYLAPSMGLINNMVAPRMRATAVALVGLAFSVVGGALGPYIVGTASDHFFLLQNPGCPLHTRPGIPLSATCVAASAHGLRTSLSMLGGFLFWASIHYFLASRHLRQDLLN